MRAERAALLADPDLRGPALRAALTDQADRWLTGLLGDETDVALLAVGGYGRKDPAPGSDLDLVLVHRGRRDIAAVADRLWYPVWDSGIGLDHAVRTVEEAVRVGREDLKAALGLLDARHVAGDPILTAELIAATRAAWRAGASRRLPELREAVAARAATAGEVAFLLEPDIKEGRGGLRDYLVLGQVAAAQVVDPGSARERTAYAVLLDIRGELHRRTGRNSDKVLLQEQDAVAAALDYADADALMAALSGAARTIAYAVDETWRRVDGWLGSGRRRWSPRRRPASRRPIGDDVVEQDGLVMLARDAAPARDPMLVLRVAAAAADCRLPISRHTLTRLAEESAPMPEPWPPAARDVLVALLGAGEPAVAVLESLDHAGLLERLLPEWPRVRSKPQRNAYHRFTVDRHLCEAAAAAAGLARTVTRPDLLLLGALLHDIGKGWPGDHTDVGVVVVAEIARRIGLPPADVDTVVALVRHHLLLPETATRRDLDDPATVRHVAEAVGDRDTLELLRALTEADSLATGPAAWSEWKAGLVTDLVRRTALVLAGRPVPSSQPLSPAQLALAERGEVAVLLEAAPGAETGVRDAGGPATVTMVAPDRPGLLAAAAGVLALHRLDVRSADATAVGATAVSRFAVLPRFGSLPDPARVRDDLRAVLEGRLSLSDRLAERERAYERDPSGWAAPRVLWLDEVAETATVLEVRAHDRLGVLHRIAGALQSCGLDVRSARLSSFGAEVIDAFYVVDSEGAKVAEPAVRDSVEAAVLAALA
ncbi:MAG: [protein-PII] uridylyltransferase [Actinomycetota bacterium]|nr:[protein-PII] uridylyltransferase [Actinomycetota bacterium]